MKKIILTGATSMLGLELIDECIQHGIIVTAIVRKNSQKIACLPNSPLIHTHECDLCDLANLSITDSDYDVFYHFAWDATANTQRYDVDSGYENIKYTLDALRLCSDIGCQRFVGAGSQAEYGRVNGTIAPYMKVSPDHAYGISKYAAGKLAAILAEQLDIEFIWTRIFSVYGVNDSPLTMISYLIDTLLKGQKPILTKCEQQWDYLYSKDAARALFLLGKKGRNQEVYNIGSGVARPLQEYVETIRDSIDHTLPLGIGAKDYAEHQVMYLCADISNLVRDTGFQPEISFEKGIQRILNANKIFPKDKENVC